MSESLRSAMICTTRYTAIRQLGRPFTVLELAATTQLHARWLREWYRPAPKRQRGAPEAAGGREAPEATPSATPRAGAGDAQQGDAQQGVLQSYLQALNASSGRSKTFAHTGQGLKSQGKMARWGRAPRDNLLQEGS